MTTNNGRVKFGIGAISAQTLGGTRREVSEALAEVVLACQVAEASGLDSVWLSEHHFADDCYLPAPLTMLAALARETERVTLATNIAIGPLYDPIRLAEDCAVIDHLSGGRLMLGLGLGYRDVEFEGLGLRRADRARRLEQCLETLRSAWQGDALEARLPDGSPVRVTPPPTGPEGPPVLVGAFAEAGIRRAARMASGWIAPELAKVSHLERRFGVLVDEGPCKENFHVVLTMSGFVAHHQARSLVRIGADHAEHQYRAWLGASDDDNVSSAAPELVDGRPPYFIAGSPEECARQLRPWYDFLAALPKGFAPHLTIRLMFPGVATSDTMEAIRLFGAEVLPRLVEEPTG